jgi:hypothetical protein
MTVVTKPGHTLLGWVAFQAANVAFTTLVKTSGRSTPQSSIYQAEAALCQNALQHDSLAALANV